MVMLGAELTAPQHTGPIALAALSGCDSQACMHERHWHVIGCITTMADSSICLNQLMSIYTSP